MQASHQSRTATPASSPADAMVKSDSLDTDLCNQCREIFPKLRKCLETPDEKGEPRLIATYGQECLEASSDCKLCNLTKSILLTTGDWIATKVGYSLWGINLLNNDGMERAQSYSKESYVGGILMETWSRPPSASTKSRKNLRQKGLIMMLSDGPYSVKAVSDKSFDIAATKRWIQDCKDGHASCKIQSPAGSKKMWVLDCHKGKVVEHRPGEAYVALSYVWGQHQQHAKKRTIDCIDLEECPNTILDAIDVTKKLGYTFLWVDRYCIDQTDERGKFTQIANMDVIYEHADLTIVAGVGDNDQYGLPGAGTPRSPLRVHQHYAQIDGLNLTSSMPDVVLELKRSTWASRGWTYQEAILSRRCLVFLPSQVHFLCRSTCRSESLPVLPELRLGERHLRTIFHHYYGLLTRVPAPSMDEFNDQELLTHIEMYTNRSLTHDSDALNAFRGILKRCDCYSFWGVPVVSGLFPLNVNPHKVTTLREDPVSCKKRFTDNIALGFLWGMNWRTNRPGEAKIRPGFPSWSWLAMKDTGIGHWFRHDNLGSILNTVNALGVDEAQPGIWFGDHQQDSWTSILDWSEMIEERRSNSQIGNAICLEGSIGRVTRLGEEHGQPNVHIESMPNSNSTEPRIERGWLRYDSSSYLPDSFQANLNDPGRSFASHEEDISALSWIVLALIHDERICSKRTECLVLQEVGDNKYRRIGTAGIPGHWTLGLKERIIVI